MCDFASIADPLEALRMRFICSVNNEEILKARFKRKADELDSNTAIQVAIQTEDSSSCEGDGLRSKIRSGAGECAESVSPKATTSAPSQEGSASCTATMLPLWQFRPYCNFLLVQRCHVQLLQINRTLGGCVPKESALASLGFQTDRSAGNG